MFDPTEFARLQAMLGCEFTFDAACNDNGDNALCPKYASPAKSFLLSTAAAGEMTWCNPPYTHAHVETFVQHYLSVKAAYPVNTGAAFCLPGWDYMDEIMRAAGFVLAHEYPVGTQLFWAPKPDGTRTLLPGVRWPVRIWLDRTARQHQVVLRATDMQGAAHVMLFDAVVAGQGRCTALLDSGAACAGQAHGFIAGPLVKRLGLKINPVTTRSVNLASGARSNILGQVICDIRLKPGFKDTVCLLVLPDGIAGVDVILGCDWMAARGADLSWRERRVSVLKGGSEHFLHPQCAVAESGTMPSGLAVLEYATSRLAAATTADTLTGKQAARLIRKGGRAFLMYVREDGEVVDATPPSPRSKAATVMAAYLNGDLHPRYAELLKAVLDDYKSVFEEFKGVPKDRAELPIGHPIQVQEGTTPPYKRMYRLSPRELAEVKSQVAELLAKGLIEPSQSPYGAPVLFVDKPDGSLRMCIDFRALNQMTVKRRYPMPNVQELFDKLRDAKVFSSLDLQSGYYQIPINKEDIPKTAFLTPVGQFQFKVLCFGLTNAPATFQAVMNHIFRKQIDAGTVLVYLDDILIFSKTLEEHMQHLKEALETLKRYDF